MPPPGPTAATTAEVAKATERTKKVLIEQIKQRDITVVIAMLNRLCFWNKDLFSKLRVKNNITWNQIRTNVDPLSMPNPDYDQNRGSSISFRHLPSFSMDLTDVRPVLFVSVPDAGSPTATTRCFTLAVAHWQGRGVHRQIGATEMMHARVAVQPGYQLNKFMSLHLFTEFMTMLKRYIRTLVVYSPVEANFLTTILPPAALPRGKTIGPLLQEAIIGRKEPLKPIRDLFYMFQMKKGDRTGHERFLDRQFKMCDVDEESGREDLPTRVALTEAKTLYFLSDRLRGKVFIDY